MESIHHALALFHCLKMKILPACLLLALTLPGVAAARKPIEKSKDLWATVNVCDSPAKDNQIGIRGSMPGWKQPARKQMRFQVQYFSRADNLWHNITQGADSGWVSLGRTPRRTVEAGQNFAFEPPAGQSLRLRGKVTFRWRRGGETLRRVWELTEAGHTSTRGADPAGYSAAECVIS
jgi:hypothetical protein